MTARNLTQRSSRHRPSRAHSAPRTLQALATAKAVHAATNSVWLWCWLQLTLPATSIFGKEDGDKRPLQAYARYLAAQTPPISPDMLVTRMKFDMKSESPKLVFAPVEWVSDYEVVKQQAESKEAAMAINMTVAQADGVAKVAPLTLGGTRPTAVTVAALPEQDETEDEAPAPAPKAKKAKAAPVVEADDEPEVRKPAAKEDAVPAKKSKLADIVADWDDE